MYSYPTKNKHIGDKYGMRKHPIKKRLMMHQGQDYKPEVKGVSNDDVYVMTDGVVKLARWQYNRGGFGKHIVVEHTIEGKPVCTLYCHLNGFKVKVGQKVKRGQLIGYMGTTGASTGVHLHFGVFECSFKYFYTKGPNGFKYPVDPDKYLLQKKEDVVPSWGVKAWKWATDESILDGENPNGLVTRLMYAQMEYNKSVKGR